jgi:parallel beta-helix repeat protein
LDTSKYQNLRQRHNPDQAGKNHLTTQQASPNMLYTPVSGDNTAALNAAALAAVAANEELTLPAGTIEVAGNWAWPSNFRVGGAGISHTIIHKTAGTAAATLISAVGTAAAPVHDIYAHDFTVDGNAVNQTCSQYYNFGAAHINNLTMEQICWKGFYNGGFVLGPEGYKPAVPNGEQINSNITIRNCIFDGSNQKVPLNNGDLLDLIWINGLVFENNTVSTSSSNGLSTEFNTNAIIRGNTITNCWRSIYMETSQHCLIYNNSISGTATVTPVSGDNPMVGIWLVDANQSYPNGGYGGCQDILVARNNIHDLVRTSGSTGIYGIQVSGPQGLPTTDINISDNTISNLSGGGTAIGVYLQGDLNEILIWKNTASNVAMGYFPCGASYAGYNRMQNVSLIDNTSLHTNWSMYSANSSSTARNFYCSGNNMLTVAQGGTNVYSGGYDVGMRTMPGFLAGNNQGF